MNKIITACLFVLLLITQPVAQAEDYRLQADQAYRDAKFKKASTLYKAALRSAPYNLDILKRIIACENILKKYDSVIKYASQAEQLYPTDVDILLAKAQVFQKKQDWDNAQNYFNKVLMLNPKHTTALVQWAISVKPWASRN